MLSILLIIFYTALFVFLLVRLSRKYRNYLSARQVTASFIIKILAGMAYGFIFFTFYHGDDTWQYHRDALTEYHTLLHHPVQFVSGIFTTPYTDTSLNALYRLGNSFWNHLDEELFVRLLAVLDVFSFGQYYVNVVLICFLFYLGNLLLFRLLLRHFPHAYLMLLVVTCYVPAVVFWLSGIRKEGVLFLGLAVAFNYFDRILQKDPRLIKNIILCASGMLTLMVMRNLVFMCVIPSFAAWWLCSHVKLRPPVVFAGVFTVTILLFFSGGIIAGMPDLANLVAERQHEFLQLEAKTRLPLSRLNGTPSAYLNVLPQALNHLFLRPYLTESKSVLQVFSALDIVLFFIFMALAIVYRRPDWRRMVQHPLVLALLSSALFGYLVIGFTIPFPGAFVRYKVVFELLFLCSFAVLSDVSRMPFYARLHKKPFV